MDLINQIAKSINSNVDDLPEKLILGYVDDHHNFTLYAQPGSRILEEDFAGNQVKLMNFEIAYQTEELGQGDMLMRKIANYLDNLSHLDDDGTYTVENLDLDPNPFITTIDVKGRGLFLLDFNITIETLRKGRF